MAGAGILNVGWCERKANKQERETSTITGGPSVGAWQGPGLPHPDMVIRISYNFNNKCGYATQRVNTGLFSNLVVSARKRENWDKILQYPCGQSSDAKAAIRYTYEDITKDA